MRTRLLALAACLVAGALAFRWQGTSPTQPMPVVVASDVADPVRSPPTELAAPPTRAENTPKSAAPPELPPSPPPAPRRLARVRLVAVDATRNEPVDPHAAFGWSFDVGCDEQEVAADASPGVRSIAALLPPGADASEVWVRIDGWGFSPTSRGFPIHALGGSAVEEIRVPLEPVADAVWTTVRIVLAATGDAGTAAESFQLFAMPRTSPHVQPRLAIEFAPGTPRERELRLPFPADELVLETRPRILDVGGRRIWISRPLVRVESTTEPGATPATFLVTRPPTAVLELELRYPDGARPVRVDCRGSWREATTDGSGVLHRNLTSSFNLAVEDAPDVIRLERYAGRLTGLTGRAFGLVSSVTPSGPLDLRLSETTRAIVEFALAPIPPPK